MRLLIKAGSGHGCSFEVRAWTEIEIMCVEGMCGLKVVWSEKNLWFKGFCNKSYTYVSSSSSAVGGAKPSTYNWQKFGSRITTDLVSYNEAGHYTSNKRRSEQTSTINDEPNWLIRTHELLWIISKHDNRLTNYLTILVPTVVQSCSARLLSCCLLHWSSIAIHVLLLVNLAYHLSYLSVHLPFFSAVHRIWCVC